MLGNKNCRHPLESKTGRETGKEGFIILLKRNIDGKVAFDLFDETVKFLKSEGVDTVKGPYHHR